MADAFVDDKAPICVPFILEHLKAHQARQSPFSDKPRNPLVIGLNGIQGVGKTTLVAALTSALAAEHVATVVCSIDDFYLAHDDQLALAKEHADNALLQHRGEPGMEPN
jgi:D-glycerate 3-kinase